MNKLKCAKQPGCKKKKSAVQYNTAIPHPVYSRKENTGKIIFVSFLNETNLGYAATSKSLVWLEVSLTGFSIRGIMKISVKSAGVMHLCLPASVLSAHAAALTCTPLTRTHRVHDMP